MIRPKGKPQKIAKNVLSQKNIALPKESKKNKDGKTQGPYPLH